MGLEELRKQIDSIDNAMLELLTSRMDVVKEVGRLKRNNNTVVYRPEREKSIIDRLEDRNQGSLTRPSLEAIFLEIFAVSRNMELPERVAYLGPEGSFTHQAAESRFGATSEYLSLPNIQSVFENVETERVRFGVVPIENNQEGTVNETIDLLCAKDVKIVAEFPMRIHFTLASFEDRIDSIEAIYSKDIAFNQCKRFLGDHFPSTIRKVPVASTSKAAKLAIENHQAAAICSPIAAKLLNLPVLFHNIEDSPNNTTRFLILSKNIINQKSLADKTSILAKISDSPGALVNFLQEFKERGINLTKIDSRPARIKDSFKFWFLIDFDGHVEDQNVQEILEEYSDTVTFLGSYAKMC